MVEEGGNLVIRSKGRHVGPGHAAIYRHMDGRFAFTFHFYDGDDKGQVRLAVRNLSWADDWPVAAETEFLLCGRVNHAQ